MGSNLSNAGVDVNQTRSAFGELQQVSAKYGELATDAALAGGGALPPPFGTAADIGSLGRSLWKQDWGGALFDVVGFVPLIGDAAKGTRIANKLNDLRRSLDVAKAAVGRNLTKTKQVAAKYWDDIAKRNRQAYEDAIKACKDKACRDGKASLKGPQYRNTPVDGPNGKWVGERGDSVWQPSNGRPPVAYKNGFPDYSPYSKGNVDIAMKGNETTDFTSATKAYREQTGNKDWKLPSDMTWHHNENGATMQLVPKNIHAVGGGAQSPHMGGASLYSGSNASEF